MVEKITGPSTGNDPLQEKVNVALDEYFHTDQTEPTPEPEPEPEPPTEPAPAPEPKSAKK